MRIANPIMIAKGYIPATKVAKAIGKSLSTVHRMIDAGQIAEVKDGRARYILLSELKKYFVGNRPILEQIANLEAWASTYEVKK